MGLYGTGFERTMYTGTPKILEDDIWVDHKQSGLVLAICKRNPKRSFSNQVAKRLNFRTGIISSLVPQLLFTDGLRFVCFSLSAQSGDE